MAWPQNEMFRGFQDIEPLPRQNLPIMVNPADQCNVHTEQPLGNARGSRSKRSCGRGVRRNQYATP
jgi:hypothetical protein